MSETVSTVRLRELLQHERDHPALHARVVRLAIINAELLEACKEALLWYGPDGDHISEPARSLLLAAIAKAESPS